MTANIIDEAPVICVTPLYHFGSDSHELVIPNDIRIVSFDQYNGPSFDGIVKRYLEIYEPPYLMLNEPLSSRCIFREDVESAVRKQDKTSVPMLYLDATMRLFAQLRLFKPGRLRAGETFIVSRNPSGASEWETWFSGRASTMTIDYQRLASQTTSYVLNSEEIPFLVAFRERVGPFFRTLESFPAFNMAFQLYGVDNPPTMEAVELVTAFESLITKKDETEGLTYRLAMRTANLMGRDADERKTIFRQVKQFYGLRSRIVHGAELDDKLTRRLEEIDSMRELLRRLLLSLMALLSDGKRQADIPDLIDELAFDEDRRKEVQKTASGFLHM
jgi:hypothetical protein